MIRKLHSTQLLNMPVEPEFFIRSSLADDAPADAPADDPADDPADAPADAPADDPADAPADADAVEPEFFIRGPGYEIVGPWEENFNPGDDRAVIVFNASSFIHPRISSRSRGVDVDPETNLPREPIIVDSFFQDRSRWYSPPRWHRPPLL